MAASDFIISALRKIREGNVGNNRANSEAVNTLISGSINALIDQTHYHVEANYPGYFGTSSIFTLPPIRIPNQSEITYYEFGIEDSGTAGGTNSIDFTMYDSTGALVGDLFGVGANAVQCVGAGVSKAVFGRNYITATTFSTNTAGFSSFQFGTPTITTIPAGYIFVPFVRSFNTSARSAKLLIRMREI